MESKMRSEFFNRGPLRAESLRHPEALVAALREAAYTEERLAATIGLSQPGETLDLALAVRRSASSEPYEVLVRLFLLRQVVDIQLAARALAPVRCEELIECGLLVPEESGVRASVKILPYGDLMCVSDFGRAEVEHDLPQDHVLGVGPASVTVAKLTVARPQGEVFDLGCGAGIQSLLAARTARRVVGTDTNPRALNFAHFNAHLNGLTGIDWREGSFFEPVAGELFDGIVANPPFVISPRGKFQFCDSQLTGDGVSEHVIRHAAGHLKEGGYATVLFNWHYDGGDDWERRPFEWCEGSGCDGWLVRSGDAEPLTYAANWLRQGEKREGERYGRLLDEWLEYYARLGIQRLCSGAMVLRKRVTARNWRRADSMEVGNAIGSASAHIERFFQAETLLHDEGDTGLLARSWRVHDDTHLHQELGWDADGWVLRSISVGLDAGLPFAGHGDAALVRLLTGCRGDRTLRELIEQLAGEIETPFETVAPSALGVARKMVRAGILIPS
jgi:methylase of polypeptide subunit release factors